MKKYFILLISLIGIISTTSCGDGVETDEKAIVGKWIYEDSNSDYYPYSTEQPEPIEIEGIRYSSYRYHVKITYEFKKNGKYSAEMLREVLVDGKSAQSYSAQDNGTYVIDEFDKEINFKSSVYGEKYAGYYEFEGKKTMLLVTELVADFLDNGSLLEFKRK